MIEPIPRTDLERLRDWLLDTLQRAVLCHSMRRRRRERRHNAWAGPYAPTPRWDDPYEGTFKDPAYDTQYAALRLVLDQDNARRQIDRADVDDGWRWITCHMTPRDCARL